MSKELEGGPTDRGPCAVCGRGEACGRQREALIGGESMESDECFRIGYWRARTLLNSIRMLIDEDTSFPGAVLRVEIDKLLGVEAV